MIVLIDNYDSFVYNLARYFERLGQPTHVVRNDALDAAGIAALRPSAVVISPGPCTPNEAGCSLEVVRQLHATTPILGVCLGHQAIAAALGGSVVRAPSPVHGRTSPILHNGEGLFAGIASPTTVCRYHSLVVAEHDLPACLQVTARTSDGTIMALAHRTRLTFGVQFHPEAILTDAGYPLLANFLRLAGLSASDRPGVADERPAPDDESDKLHGAGQSPQHRHHLAGLAPQNGTQPIAPIDVTRLGPIVTPPAESSP